MTTRSSNKKNQSIATTTASNNKKTRNPCKIQEESSKQESLSQEPSMMNIELSSEMREHQLDLEDFMPLCFSSQETKPIESTDLLSEPSNFNLDWKYQSEDSLSSQESCLDAVDMHLVSSLAYSPASIACQSMPTSPPAYFSAASPEIVPIQSEKTTADELLEAYFPDVDQDDDFGDILDIMDQEVQPTHADHVYTATGDVLPRYSIVMNPPADSLALALSSQYEEGVTVIENPGYVSQEVVSSPVVVKEEPVEIKPSTSRGRSSGKIVKKPTSKRGRKRKAYDDLSGDEKKRIQNAEAAKQYRQRKVKEMARIFDEKAKMESELEKTRKKFEAKMNERNILLKMLYEAYIEEGSSMTKTIKFPDWLPVWYEKQKDM